MYKVIGNERALTEWEQETKDTFPIWGNAEAVRELKKAVSQLDYSYGAQRDLEKDLGGYTVVYWGSTKEIEREKYSTFQYYHLQESEYEYEDIYIDDERKCSATFRLYLCSGDYSLLMISLE